MASEPSTPIPPVLIDVPRDTLDATRSWRRLTLAAALIVTSLETVLLQRKYGLFTGGFLATNPFGTWADSAAFIFVVLLLNATGIAPLCAFALFVGDALRLRPRALRFGAVAISCAPLLLADFVMYRVWAYLGDAFDFHLMFVLTGRRVSEIFAVTAPLLFWPVTVGLLFIVGFVAAIAWIHRAQSDSTTIGPVVPQRATIVRGSFMLLVFSGITALIVGMSSESMMYGLRRVPAGDLAMRLLDNATDFDRDGYGLLRDPRDTAPFNASVHPYALEIPGNGVDENGLAGDLPLNRAEFLEPSAPHTSWRLHPPIILFLLESFRADVVGARYAAQPVTPVIDALARRGVKVESAWSHNGFTRQSRFHILSGSLTGRGTTLLDDFKDNGYDVAYFSGQDDTAFGSPGISYERIDKYYDARQDLNRRYSTYSAPGSLSVPFNVLEEQIQQYLNQRQSRNPLFLYVNFEDTHYPYHHPSVKRIISGDPLPAGLISPGHRGDLWRTYLNTAANVDAAIGRVINAVRARVGAEPAVIVLSDHGESLFDGGFLGHGYALNAAQTRIPLVVAGLPMRITVPFGQSALRDAVNSALTGEVALDVRPVIERSNRARVFQYLGPLETPGAIAWLSGDGWFTYDFRRNRVALWDTNVKPEELVGGLQQTFADLVNTWESIQLAIQSKGLAGAKPDKAH